MSSAHQTNDGTTITECVRISHSGSSDDTIRSMSLQMKTNDFIP